MNNNEIKIWKRFVFYNVLFKPTEYAIGMEKYLYNKD